MESETADLVQGGPGRRRRGWAVLAVGVLVLVVIAAAVTPRWIKTSRDEPARAGAPGKTGAVPVTVPPSGAAAFDPMRRVISVGQVPNLRVTEYATARYWQTATLEDDKRYFRIEVRVYPRGNAAEFINRQGPSPVDPSKGTRAEPVGGAPAWWLPDAWLFQYEAVRLAWKWGDGGWIYVTAASTDDQGQRPKVPAERMRAMARQVADAVHADAAGTPVTMPFTMPPPPAGYRVSGTHLLRGVRDDGGPILRATLIFGAGPDQPNPDVRTRDAGPELQVTAALTTPDDKPGSASRTVDGHPVAEHDGGVVVFGVGEGFAVEVGGGGIDVARSVSILPGSRDESAWTDRPVR